MKHLTKERTVVDERSTSLLEEIENIAVGVSQLAGAASNLSSVYQSKASDEADLPTVSSALRSTNQVIINLIIIARG